MNGAHVSTAHDLARKIAATAPGTSVNIAVLRKGEQKSFTVTLGKLPDETRQASSSNGKEQPGLPHLGLTLSPANDVAGSGGKGVAVTAVDPEGPAAEHGFQVGDVILDVAGRPVATPADVRKELSELRKEGKRAALMRVQSGDATRFIAMPLGNA